MGPNGSVNSDTIYILTHLDTDSVGAAWLHAKLTGRRFKEIYWHFLRNVEAVPDFGEGKTVFWFDCGKEYDGQRHFDHHQEDPAVKHECAMSLVWKSFPDLVARHDFLALKTAVEYVRMIDHARTKELKEGQWGPYVGIIFDVGAVYRGLSRSEDYRSKMDKLRVLYGIFEAYYNNAAGVHEGLKEINLGENIAIIEVDDVGRVLIGSTDRTSREVRALARTHLRSRADIAIVSYPDKVGLTNINQSRYPLDCPDFSRFVEAETGVKHDHCPSENWLIYWPAGSLTSELVLEKLQLYLKRRKAAEVRQIEADLKSFSNSDK
jgi:hypothetical protein